MLVEEKPMNRALRFADFLLYLEDSLARAGRDVRFDYVMYKRNEEAIEDLVNHKLEFLRIGGLSYLDAHSRDTNVVVFATQRPAKTAKETIKRSMTCTTSCTLSTIPFAASKRTNVRRRPMRWP